MSGQLSSARSYTSTSGNTSVPVSSSVTPSGSSAVSSSASSTIYTAGKLGKRFDALVKGKPRYDPALRRAGDVFFHIIDDNVGHTNMTTSDTTKKVDSMDGSGVRIVPLTMDSRNAIVFRFHDAAVALRAAKLAEGWANSYDTATKKYGNEGVGYSGGPSLGIGVTGRVIGALMGSSHFGKGAKARLLKYQNRTGMKPRNVICSEMCILAFQLSMAETDAGFIKLDAKHSIPTTFFKYLLNEGKNHWTIVARR
ncbi:hypothetical protein [Muricoccus radiodurans]|uniref:hypothetical protein n=1 Tax=Muricoccus radiodurans TaxID=2231721 RepID=UPI003CEB1026